MAIRGDYIFGKELCKILGLNSEEIRSISINAEAGKVSTVTIVRFAKKEDIEFADHLITEKYELVPIET